MRSTAHPTRAWGATWRSKFSHEARVSDPERLARFEREARVLASLNHPNIATVHGVEVSPDPSAPGRPPVHALVMELVDGVTLAE